MEEKNDNKEVNIAEQLETGYKLKKWSSLDMLSLETLIVICETDGQKLKIYDELLKGASHNSNYGQTVWARINKLVEQKLVWIEREAQSGRVERFLFHEDLKTTLKEQFPNLFHKSNEPKPLDHFQFSLRKEHIKVSSTQPDYSGFFRLGKDVVLKEGHQYQFGGWINDDGSIFIKIVPHDENIMLGSKREEEPIIQDENPQSPEV